MANSPQLALHGHPPDHLPPLPIIAISVPDYRRISVPDHAPNCVISDFLNLTRTPTHIPNQSFVKKFFGLFFVFGFF
jgi:hypothetical protein